MLGLSLNRSLSPHSCAPWDGLNGLGMVPGNPLADPQGCHQPRPSLWETSSSRHSPKPDWSGSIFLRIKGGFCV